MKTCRMLKQSQNSSAAGAAVTLRPEMTPSLARGTGGCVSKDFLQGSRGYVLSLRSWSEPNSLLYLKDFGKAWGWPMLLIAGSLQALAMGHGRKLGLMGNGSGWTAVLEATSCVRV